MVQQVQRNIISELLFLAAFTALRELYKPYFEIIFYQLIMFLLFSEPCFYLLSINFLKIDSAYKKLFILSDDQGLVVKLFYSIAITIHIQLVSLYRIPGF